MSNGRRRYLPLAVIFVMTLLLVFLFQKSRGVDAETHAAVISLMLDLKQFDAMLNQDVLEIRYHSQLNMDAVSHHALRTRELLTAIRMRFAGANPRIREQMQQVERHFAQKLDLIERFKAHNGTLNNSLRYLPAAARESADKLGRHSYLRLEELLYRLLRHVLMPGESQQQQIESLVVRAADIPIPDHVLLHVNIVLREHRLVSGMMEQLLETPAFGAIEALFEQYDHDYRQQVEGAGKFQGGLIVFSILLLFYIFNLFRRLRNSAEHLRGSLREVEFQKRALDEHAIVAVTDAEGRITYANDKFRKISGYSEDKLIGATHRLVSSGHHDRAFYAEMWGTISSGSVWQGEVLNRSKDGDDYWIDTTIVPFLDEHGVPFRYVAICTDITRQKLAQLQLQNKHALLKQVFAAIPSILIGVDREGSIYIWNPVAEGAFSIVWQDAVGRDFNVLGIDWEWDKIDQALVDARNNGFSQLENFNYQRPDGSDGFLGISLLSLMDNGLDGGVLLLASDVTERIRLQNQLQLAQKMEAVGELASGIAHEINTPLQYSGDNIRFLRDSFADLMRLLERYATLREYCAGSAVAPELTGSLKDLEEEIDFAFLAEEIPAAITQSLEGLEKAGTIVGAMKEFSHPGQKEKIPTDINRMLENTITVARNEWKYVAQMQTEFDDELPLVVCLPELNQVFLNMIVNAAHAIEAKYGHNASEPGTITIRTRHDAQFVTIEISDDGCGIDSEHRQKVFHPFFTTKEVGHGTGQGLAISHAIVVELHRGSIDVISEKGEGSTFVIRLPISPKESD